MKNAMRSATPHYTWIQGCYWMVYCILLSFSSVYLLEQGLSNTEIGLLLGLSAWFLPLWGLRRQSRKAGAEAALWCWAGALCCAAALYFQLRYGDSYVQAGDWSALMDTSGAAVWLSGFLLATSCVMQLAVLFAARWRKRSED